MTYDIIMADPPWKYNMRGFDDRLRGGHRRHYDGMSLQAIKDLSVDNVSGKDALLYLWVTSPFLAEGLEVIEAWGFNFKTVAFYWIKTNKGKGQSWANLYEMMAANPSEEHLKALPDFAQAGYFFGNGHYTKANGELCLLGRKGKTPHIFKPATDKVSNVIVAPVRRHSQKPWEAYYRIEQMYPDKSKLEMFARETRDGWDCWGNEVASDVDMEASC